MKDYLLGAENTVMKKLKIAVDARTLGSRPSGVGRGWRRNVPALSGHRPVAERPVRG